MNYGSDRWANGPPDENRPNPWLAKLVRFFMRYEITSRVVRDTLRVTFSQVDSWFDRPEEVLQLRPRSGKWSVIQVLDHIVLTNHFLVLTLLKQLAVAEQRASRGDLLPDGESDLDRLNVIGERGSFGWPNPEHMEPSEQPSPKKVRADLHTQLDECLKLLERMGGGVGALVRVTMSVNDLGKIDLYQWLYFLAQHARRHLQQLEAIEEEAKGNVLALKLPKK